MTEHLTEVDVIVALMGAGLKIDRPLSRRGWASTWRLLAIAMPVTCCGRNLRPVVRIGCYGRPDHRYGSSGARMQAGDVRWGKPAYADSQKPAPEPEGAAWDSFRTGPR
ncbi:hypothetical protein [Actinoplanes solisilvae]|uniref:hypothetical protein n=1 Tax=Actinoplanes solisilvae TaxID=2486853 RepID=UPI001F0C04A4|nr:hypothetical protein [Actinoplanes solisilvae]